MFKNWLNALLTLLVLIAQPVLAAPTGNLNLPVSGSAYSAPASIPLYVSATPATGTTVSKVELYSGTTWLGTLTTAPYSATWSPVAVGTYALSAKIYDSVGAVTITNTATVTVYAVDPANTPPTVNIINPVNNAAYSAPASIPLGVNVADNAGINRVEYYINGALYYVVGYPYSATMGGVPAGTYTITAKAYDNLGVATTSAAITATVYTPSGTNVAPSATLTSPANNTLYNIATATASVPMNVTASDSDGTINRVEFYSGTVLLGSLSSGPYNAALALPYGTYSLWARAYDNLGAFTSTGTSNVTVNALPTVSVTAPANNAVYNAPATVTLTASATDTDGTIAKVEFYSGTTLVGTVTASPYTITLSSVAAGAYSYTAKAYDNLGGITASTAAAVSVNAATNVPPTVSMMAPANNALYFAPATHVLSATAADSDGTIAKVEFYSGTTLVGTAWGSPYTVARTNVVAGTYSYTAKAYDNLGGVSVSTAVSVVVDALPTVSITAPANNTVYTAPATVILTASATDTDGTIAKVEFYSGTTLVGTTTGSPYTITLSNLAAGTYSYTAKAYDNLGGITTSSAISVVSNALPTVSITAPANNAVYTAPATVTLTADAADTGGGTVNKVEFYSNGGYLGQDTSSPYTWTVTSVGAGTYNYTAKAYDNLNAVTVSAPVTVIVNALPTVNLTAPLATGNYTALASIKFTALASDTAGGTIAKVEYYVDSVLAGGATVSPYTFNASVSPGTHNVYAKAIDNLGGTNISAVTAITVNATNTPPVVAMSAPANTAVINLPNAVNFSASASDNTETNGGIAKVEFFVNGVSIGSSATPAANGRYEYLWSNTPAGTYTVYAQATDTAGAVSVTATNTFTVNTLPTVSMSIANPVMGFYAPASLTVNATASDSDAGDGINRVVVYQNNVQLGSISTKPYVKAVTGLAAGTYVYKVQAFDNRGASTYSDSITITVNSTATPANYQYDEVGRLIGVQH